MPDPIATHPDLKYGVASRYDFDNPQKWVTVPGVPLLDEHQMTDAKGQVVATVDRKVLEQIAANNNARVRETGDPATLILGHTSDDPRAPEKPAQGFVVNYRVAPFKRDPATGAVTYAIHGDYKIRPKKAHLVEDYPRRSVELWWHKKELDPIAMLGGSAPERDLSVVVKNARLNHVSIGSPVRSGARDAAGSGAGEVIRFHRRGHFTIEDYAIEDRLDHGARLRRYAMTCVPGAKGGPMDYEADDFGGPDDELDTQDLHDPGDAGTPDPSDDSGAGETDPLLAKVFQSKQFRDLGAKLDMVLQTVEELAGALGGGAGGEEQPMGPDDGAAPELPPPGGAGAAPVPDENDPDDDEPEEESRRGMGERPVQMNQTAFPGSADVAIPGFVGERNRMSRSTNSRGGTPNRAPVQQQRQQRRAAQQPADDVVRMRRQVHDLTLRFAQAEADKRVEALVAEGIRFGRSAEEHEEGVAETKAHFAGLLASAHANGAPDEGEADLQYEEGIIRSRYARRAPNPAAPAAPGLARFARDPNPREGAPAEGAGDPDDFVPEDPEQATLFADLQAVRKMSRAEAVKFMRQRFGGR